MTSDRLRADEFEDMVGEYAGSLFALSFSLLRDAHDAEDAVQAVMEKAWRKWGTLRDPEARGGWLRTICIRECLRRRRRRTRDLTSEVREAVAIAPDRDLDMELALRRLSSKQRAVVVLHYGHGYTLDECAGLMGISPGATRSHLHRALSSLREELAIG